MHPIPIVDLTEQVNFVELLHDNGKLLITAHEAVQVLNLLIDDLDTLNSLLQVLCEQEGGSKVDLESGGHLLLL